MSQPEAVEGMFTDATPTKSVRKACRKGQGDIATTRRMTAKLSTVTAMQQIQSWMVRRRGAFGVGRRQRQKIESGLARLRPSFGRATTTRVFDCSTSPPRFHPLPIPECPAPKNRGRDWTVPPQAVGLSTLVHPRHPGGLILDFPSA